MSTRSTVHFEDSWGHIIVYIHHDGYPDVRGKAVLEFLRLVRDDLKDSRTEAGVMAARFVAFSIDRYHQVHLEHDFDDDHPLDPISVKLMNEDPGDIEYRYRVRCDEIEDDGLPQVKMDVIHWKGPDETHDLKVYMGEHLKEVT